MWEIEFCIHSNMLFAFEIGIIWYLVSKFYEKMEAHRLTYGVIAFGMHFLSGSFIATN